MNMVTLGNTGLKVSAISFGGIPIQRSDAANTLAVVDELEKFGINSSTPPGATRYLRNIWVLP